MEKALCAFKVGDCGSEGLRTQISSALEKYTEMKSREAYPKMWAYTDKLNATAKERKTAKSYSKIWSIICIVLGAVLFIPGLMNPSELMGPLVIGAAGIIIGVARISRGRKAGVKNRFDDSADKLISDIEDRKKEDYTASFGPDYMEVTDGEGNSIESVLYDCFEMVIETCDLYMLIFDGKACPLLKSDIQQGTCSDFEELMHEKTKYIDAE